eukprot:364705-Chlamydomonas_euryale.AAC.8
MAGKAFSAFPPPFSSDSCPGTCRRFYSGCVKLARVERQDYARGMEKPCTTILVRGLWMADNCQGDWCLVTGSNCGQSRSMISLLAYLRRLSNFAAAAKNFMVVHLASDQYAVPFSLCTWRKSMMRRLGSALIIGVSGDNTCGSVVCAALMQPLDKNCAAWQTCLPAPTCSSLLPLKSITSSDVILARQSGSRVKRLPPRLNTLSFDSGSRFGRMRLANVLICSVPMGWLRSRFCSTSVSSCVSAVMPERLTLLLPDTSSSRRLDRLDNHGGSASSRWWPRSSRLSSDVSLAHDGGIASRPMIHCPVCSSPISDRCLARLLRQHAAVEPLDRKHTHVGAPRHEAPHALVCVEQVVAVVQPDFLQRVAELPHHKSQVGRLEVVLACQVEVLALVAPKALAIAHDQGPQGVLAAHNEVNHLQCSQGARPHAGRESWAHIQPVYVCIGREFQGRDEQVRLHGGRKIMCEDAAATRGRA